MKPETFQSVRTHPAECTTFLEGHKSPTTRGPSHERDDMQYKNLGKSGLVVSGACLGCMSFGDPTKGRHSWILNRPIIRHVVESGINFFDTANMYGGRDGTREEVLGRVIKDMRRCVRHLQSPQLRQPLHSHHPPYRNGYSGQRQSRLRPYPALSISSSEENQ